MSLRQKSLLLLTVSILCMMLGLVYISQQIMQTGFGKVEEADARENVSRVKDGMAAQVESLHTKLADWAAWDDAYQYVQDGNEDFVKSNLNLAALQNMKVDLLAFYNESRQLVWGQTLTGDREGLEDFHKNLQDHIASHPSLFELKDESSTVDGIVLVGDMPWIFTAQPVVTSEQKGPIKGTLIGGRRIDDEFIKKLSQVTHMQVSLGQYADPALGAEFRRAKDALAGSESQFIQRISEDQISGFYSETDAYGQPVLLVRMEKPRAIHAQGVSTTNIFLTALLAASLVFGLVITLLLETSVLRPLTGLNSVVRKIDNSGDLSLRVPVKSRDEVGQLATAMNGMLDSIESNKNSMKLLLDNTGQGFISVDATGTISRECSKAAAGIFSQNPAGMPLWTLLGQDESQWKTNLEMIFAETLDFKDLVTLLPPTVTIAGKIIELEYRPVRSIDQKLSHVMVVATDVTAVRELQRKADQERRTNASLVKILGSKNDFLESVELVNSLSEHRSDPLVFKRYLHTLKGSFAFLDCLEQSQLCHEWEKHLKEDHSPATMARAALEIQASVREFTERHAQILNLSASSERTLPVNLSTVKTLFSEAVRMSVPQPILRIIEQLPERPATEVLGWLGEAATSTAEQLGKEVGSIQWQPSCAIDPAPYSPLFKSIIHLVRNAVDHGIEFPDDREQLGKPRSGSLVASLSLHDGVYCLRIKDDGQGIDADKLRQRAGELGIPVPKTDSEALDLIFGDGFSSRTEVTTTSGRGVGLAAVRAEARKLGGDVRVSTAPGEGTEFVVTFRKVAPYGASVVGLKKVS